MLLDELAFGSYREIEPGIVEAIIHEGVEMDDTMIQQAEAGLIEKYGNTPYALLVNRINSYSHTVKSMMGAAKMSNLIATAIIIYSRTGRSAAELHLPIDPNPQVFDSRNAALTWLRKKIQTA